MKTCFRLCAAAWATLGVVCSTQAQLQAPQNCEQMARAHEQAQGRARSQVKVVLVKTFANGQPIRLAGDSESRGDAKASICLVKLLAGAGNPGPADAPSTTQGIGIEVWLPQPQRWNGRLHITGGGGYAGGPHGDPARIARSRLAPWDIAAVEGAVSAATNTGHATPGGSFLMQTDGLINRAGWADFAYAGIHAMAVHANELAKRYYGRAPDYRYFQGGSTGGRQGLMFAQRFPELFDGIIADYPAINWTRFITAELNPQIAMQEDLGYTIAPEKLDLVSVAAIKACDPIGLGYPLAPQDCRYDPARDAAVLCNGGESGGGQTTQHCVTAAEAHVINKIWYGQTDSGAIASPAESIGTAPELDSGQLWYGLLRGTNLNLLAGSTPFPIASTQVALQLQDATIADAQFHNATGAGRGGWRALGYAGLRRAHDRGLALQPAFASINTDDPDLSAYAEAGGKLLVVHGLADQLIPAQGTVHYYESVLATLGGADRVAEFFRLYLAPGLAHGYYNGTATPDAALPVPSAAQLYKLMTDWVEQNVRPQRFILSTPADAQPPSTLPLCPYPQKIAYRSGDIRAASSFDCID